MKHLFYFITLLPIMYEAMSLLEIKKVNNFINSFKDIPYEEHTKKQKSFSYLSLGYMTWAFVGLFSFQWYAFILLFAFAFISKKHIVIHFIDSLISFLVLIFIILNAYHFHITFHDLWKML